MFNYKNKLYLFIALALVAFLVILPGFLPADNLLGQLTLPQKSLGAEQAPNVPFKDILAAKGIVPGASQELKIIVDKSDKTLSIYFKDSPLKSYHVELGEGGTGDKQVAGDHKNPEGQFYVSEKSVLSPPDQYLGSRWMRLSYPNIEDAQRGLNSGLINRQIYNEIVAAISNGTTPPQRTALGGGIGIHGGDVPAFNDNWTWGCIGLANRDIEDFFNYISVGTPVIIQK